MKLKECPYKELKKRKINYNGRMERVLKSWKGKERLGK